MSSLTKLMKKVSTNHNGRFPVLSAGIAGGVVAGIGIIVRLAVLHVVSPLEDIILRSLLEHGVSLALSPIWTEPLVGLTEVAASACFGVMIGLVAAALHWSVMRSAYLTVAIAGAAQVVLGLLPRVPL